MTYRPLRFIIFAFLLFFLAIPVLAQDVSAQNVIFEDKSLFAPDELLNFYQKRDMKPFWFRGAGDFQPRVDAAIQILDQSWTHGLNSKRYNLNVLKSYKTKTQVDDRINLDVVLMDSILRYMHDMTAMRGGEYAQDKKAKYWRIPKSNSEILMALDNAHNPISVIKDAEPAGKLYTALRKELMAILASPQKEKFKLIAKEQTLKPGNLYPQIPAIRERLGRTQLSENPNLYDEALAVEVIKIQKSYGLNTNGVISGRTIDVLNMTDEDKISQIIVNMDRLRWMEEGRPNRYVLVNIPSASLWAVENGDVKLEMPVIIGKTARPTVSFKTDISGVRFNPNWTVPKTIKNDDFLPALQTDSLALSKRGITIFYDGDMVDPTTVDWKTVTSKGMNNLKLVQDPGDDNPLGKVRVIMENPFDIYLHDTNHKEAFDKDDRALSSGCIRVAQPEKLADFILKENEGWTWDGMEKIIASGKMRDVPVTQKLPVYILYQTVWLGSEGSIVYGKDVYGQDKKLYNMLKKNDSIPF